MYLNKRKIIIFFILWLILTSTLLFNTSSKTITLVELQEKEVEVEKIVYQEVIKEIEVKDKYAYTITESEREMLARLVYLEANTESLDCQIAIVSVVFNRLQNGYWGNTLKKVIYAKGQFSPSNIIYKTTPTDINYEAVDYVLKNSSQLPKYVMYFRANKNHSGKEYVEYMVINNVYFGYFKKDKGEDEK